MKEMEAANSAELRQMRDYLDVFFYTSDIEEPDEVVELLEAFDSCTQEAYRCLDIAIRKLEEYESARGSGEVP